MAMTICRECGGDVSTSARTCPHCGVKNPGMSKGKHAVATGCGTAACLPWIIGIIILFLLLMLGM